MRVAFVHDAPLVRTEGGNYFSQGLSYSVWERYLSVFDQVTVLTRVRDAEVDGMATSSGPGVAFRPVTAYRGPSDLLSRFKAVRKEISDGLDDVDCVIARLPSVLGTLALLDARKRGMPALVELVGCAWDSYWHHGSLGKVLAPFAYLLTRRLVGSTEFVVYVTESFLQRRYPCKGSTECISNVALDVNESVLQRRLERMKYPGSVVRLGSTGQVDVKYKGHHLVILAMRMLQTQIDLRYEIVGGGDQEQILRAAEFNGLAECVSPLGRMKSDQIYEWLDSIDVYIQPSLTEGLPRALLEAMSRGLPVVGSTAGGIPELLGPEALFNKGDAESLAERIQWVLDSDWREQARRNHRVSVKYSSEVLRERRDQFLALFLASASQKLKSRSRGIRHSDTLAIKGKG